ncbi:DUF397 domain-containing protein [Streptomyces durmitorensis]|uniref:DUF397 domain-containing protein n=1 Tax=Streptomyces durmitorensis TaxID=319947 RepID=A0ABY4PQU3_9ACTN|nr:DUF397 domain-containing protein [Streptomyces durmitorensis]UQT56198.1 DUF397 domain-containing protein [Streptomyces durmitorensis]
MTIHYFTAADLAPDDAWYRSSYSGGTGNNCVEVADLTTPTAPRPGIGVRDSKNPTGPALLLRPSTWSAFVTHVRATSI